MAQHLGTAGIQWARWIFGIWLITLLLISIAVVTTFQTAYELDIALVVILGVLGPTTYFSLREFKGQNIAQAAQIASEIRFRRLFEAAQDGILILDFETGMIQAVNPYLAQLLGLPRKDLLGKRLFELGFFHDVVCNKVAFEELRRNEYIRYEDKPLKNAEGREIAVEFVSNVYLENGEKIIQCNIRDISERIQAAEASQRNQLAELKYEHERAAILDALPAHIALLDGDGKIVTVNAAWVAFAAANGLACANSCVGQNYLDVCESAHGLHAEGGREVAAGIRAVLRGESSQYSQEYPCHSPGERRWFSLTAAPVGKELRSGSVVMHVDFTERKLVDEGLTLFMNLTNQISDAVQALDPVTGHFLSINESGHAELGYSREEFLALTVFDINPTLTPTSFAALVQDLRESGPKLFTSIHRRKDGTEYPTEVSVRLVQLESDYLVAQVRDVTTRNHAEAVLRKSEARFRTLLESIPQNIMIKDLESRYVSINENYAQLLGIASDEAVGKVDYDFFPKELAEKYRSDDKRVMASGEIAEFDEKLSRNGEEVWVHTFKAPMHDENGKVYGVLATFWDITGQKADEEKINLQAAVLEATANAIVITDTQGKIEWVNPAFTSFTGYSLEEAVGKLPRELIWSGKHDTAFYQEMWKTITAGLVWQGELTNRRKDGTLYTEVQTITPIRDSTGVIKHYAGVKLDVTEQRKLEQELIQAQKIESVGRLAGGVAHDFNNLLTVISGYTEMAMGTMDKDGKTHADLLQAYKAAERAASLTRQLLAFSRRQVLQPKVLDLNVVITDCTKMLERLIGEDIAFVMKPGDGLWSVMADPGQIEQIFMNLVINARDAMPMGGTVVIETSNHSTEEHIGGRHLDMAPGSYVCLALSDTGTGMDEATQAKIFEPCVSTREIGRGPGLGLATVHGIVKQSGGSIFVYSELGKGTTFKIYLPRIVLTDTLTNGGALMKGILRGTETILLVEDEEPLRLLTERILTQAGYAVLSANNGVNALMIAEQKENEIHLVLTDVIMPGMGGRELVNQLREEHPDYKILYMSGYTDTAIAVHGVLESGTQLLGKPFSGSQLTHKVREVLDMPRN